MVEKSVGIDDSNTKVVPLVVTIEVDGVKQEWELHSRKKAIHFMSELAHLIDMVLMHWDEIPFTEE